MADPRVDFEAWLASPGGHYLMSWEHTKVDAAVVDAFGYFAFQMGMTEQNFLDANRMPHRKMAGLANVQGKAPEYQKGAHLLLDPHFLPFQPNHLDLLVYPHALERCRNPQQAIREAERVLVPDGRLIITGLNPYGLKAVGKDILRLGRRLKVPPEGRTAARPIAIWRLKEWLQLLGFEIESVQIGGDRHPHWFGQPLWGLGYCIVAVKKVPGMRLLTAPWQKRPAAVSALGHAARNRSDVRSAVQDKLK
jgi:SAM-dependent methyltransferase